MKRRLSLRYKLLLALLTACALISLGAWAVLAATICSNPRAPVPETEHVLPYNCHGMTVFISETQALLLHWLFPIFALLSLVAVVMTFLALVKVRISVKIRRSDARQSGNESAP